MVIVGGCQVVSMGSMAIRLWQRGCCIFLEGHAAHGAQQPSCCNILECGKDRTYDWNTYMQKAHIQHSWNLTSVISLFSRKSNCFQNTSNTTWLDRCLDMFWIILGRLTEVNFHECCRSKAQTTIVKTVSGRWTRSFTIVVFFEWVSCPRAPSIYMCAGRVLSHLGPDVGSQLNHVGGEKDTTCIALGHQSCWNLFASAGGEKDKFIV